MKPASARNSASAWRENRRFPFAPPHAIVFRMSAVEQLKAEIEKLTPGEIEKVQTFLASLRAEHERRRASVRELRGKYKDFFRPVDEFLKEKHEAGDRW